jgi:hypothetical protein
MPTLARTSQNWSTTGSGTWSADLDPLPNHKLPPGFERLATKHNENSFALPTQLGLQFSDRLWSFNCDPVLVAMCGFQQGWYQQQQGEERSWPEIPTTITPIQWVALAPAAP